MAEDPTTRSLTTIETGGHSEGSKRTRIETKTAEFVVGADATPLEHLLGSLAACINVIGHPVATDRGMVVALDPTCYFGTRSGRLGGPRVPRINPTLRYESVPTTEKCVGSTAHAASAFRSSTWKTLPVGSLSVTHTSPP